MEQAGQIHYCNSSIDIRLFSNIGCTAISCFGKMFKDSLVNRFLADPTKGKGIEMENDIEIDELIENITLNVFNIGTKHINFKILKSLPTNVNSIMEETQLTKVPVNILNRVSYL